MNYKFKVVLIVSKKERKCNIHDTELLEKLLKLISCLELKTIKYF